MDNQILKIIKRHNNTKGTILFCFVLVIFLVISLSISFANDCFTLCNTEAFTINLPNSYEILSTSESSWEITSYCHNKHKTDLIGTITKNSYEVSTFSINSNNIKRIDNNYLHYYMFSDSEKCVYSFCFNLEYITEEKCTTITDTFQIS